MDLQLQPFSAINLADSFFDSLKEAYPEFSVWYNKKAAAGERDRGQVLVPILKISILHNYSLIAA